MEPSTSSPNNPNVEKPATPLNLQDAGYVGTLIIGYNRNAKPRTLGRVRCVTDHSQTSVVDVDNYGKIALDRCAWQQENMGDNRVLVHPAPPEKQHYVRFAFQPMETPLKAS